jgi:hypothetical protein
MDPQKAVSSVSLSHTWRFVLWANFILGIFLWFGLCTDYSWDSFWVNTCYPPVVGIVGLVSLVAVLKKEQHRLKIIYCLPSVTGGLPYIIIPILAIMVCWLAFVGGVLYDVGEEATRTCIERAVSPDGSKVAEVHFLTLDASGEHGRIEICLKYNWLPFIRRDIHGFGYVDKDTRGYLAWQDNNSLRVSEKKLYADREVEIEVGLVKWKIPFIPLHLQR